MSTSLFLGRSTESLSFFESASLRNIFFASSLLSPLPSLSPFSLWLFKSRGLYLGQAGPHGNAGPTFSCLPPPSLSPRVTVSLLGVIPESAVSPKGKALKPPPEGHFRARRWSRAERGRQSFVMAKWTFIALIPGPQESVS